VSEFDPNEHMGRLLRLSMGALEHRMKRRLKEGGFEDLSPTQIKILLAAAAGPQRPGELAVRCGMTRQAMNHMVIMMRDQDYMEKTKGAPGEGPRLLFLTAKGMAAAALAVLTSLEFERDYREAFGSKVFDDVLLVLRAMANEAGGDVADIYAARSSSLPS
jgi:DNA-binding MarR family transcriptional regulator